jgi:ferredoxin
LDVTESPYYRELSNVDAIDATRFLKAPSDFFELLDLDLDDADVWASRDEAMVQSIVQTAFKKKLKISHPDVLTSKYADISEEETNGFAVILNAAYKTLSDRQTREPYLLAVIDFRKHFFLSEETKFDGTPVSKWSGEEGETRAVFVDESECIGCGNCAQYAAKTFSMDVDKDYGRARVINQWADDSETIEIAIDMCPVDCIWFVKRNQLAALEHCMKFCPREDPGIMGRRRGGNFGSQRAKHNPFSAAESFLKRFDENGELFGGKNPAGLSFSWHDERLASTIAKAWLSLPAEVRRQGWSEFKHKFNTSGVGGDYSVEDRTFLKTR